MLKVCVSIRARALKNKEMICIQMLVKLREGSREFKMRVQAQYV